MSAKTADRSKLPDMQEVIESYPEYFTGIHPIANLFPDKSLEAFWELVDDIDKSGVAEPILYEEETGLLVDGRHRLMACYVTGQLFRVEPIAERILVPTVRAKNLLCKTGIPDAKRVDIAKELLSMELAYKAKANQRKGGRPTVYGNSNKGFQNSGNLDFDPNSDLSISETEAINSHKEIAKTAGVSHDTVAKVLKVDKYGAPEVKEAMYKGEISPNKAYQTVKDIKPERKKPAKEKGKVRVITADGRETFIDAPEKPVFNVTNNSVDWAGFTWNPVTGCEHGCKFCYAREIAHSDRMAPFYPFQFAPSFHEYRLEAPANTKIPKSAEERPQDGRVFVCSMADLFGKWVPDEWINKVFLACAKAPEWEYLFLTKWPKRYSMLTGMPKAWFGASIIKQGDVRRVEEDMKDLPMHDGITRWISLEPMLEPIRFNDLAWCDLVVIGAQTSTVQPTGKVEAFSPKFEWVADVVAQCREAGVPYYLKDNLLTAPGMELPKMNPRRK